MKDQTKRTFVLIIFVMVIWFYGFWGGHLFWPKTTKPEPIPIQDTTLVEEVEPTLDDHIVMIVPDKLQDICRAIIWVESRGNAKAFRESGNCLGILQITPIYVKECNRLQSDIVYTLEDRTDPIKSLEMFTIIQNHHNPCHDLERAIELHNPTAGSDYREKVLRRFNTIY